MIHNSNFALAVVCYATALCLGWSIAFVNEAALAFGFQALTFAALGAGFLDRAMRCLS